MRPTLWDHDHEWDQIIDLDGLWLNYERIIKPAGVIALTGTATFTARLILSNLKLFKYKIVWIKSKSTNFLKCEKTAFATARGYLYLLQKATGLSTPNDQG